MNPSTETSGKPADISQDEGAVSLYCRSRVDAAAAIRKRGEG